MRELIEAIYQNHRQGLYTLALSITRNPDRAEDAVHDAVVRLCRTSPTPTGDPVAYVFAAVRNAAIDIKRKRTELPVGDQWSLFESAGAVSRINGGGGGIKGGRSAGHAVARLNGNDAGLGNGNGEGAWFSEGEPVAVIIADEAARIVRHAIDHLPEAQKQVLVMKLYGGLTFDQIAKAHGEPLSTVASRYRRALDKLKDQLQPVVE